MTNDKMMKKMVIAVLGGSRPRCQLSEMIGSKRTPRRMLQNARTERTNWLRRAGRKLNLDSNHPKTLYESGHRRFTRIHAHRTAGGHRHNRHSRRHVIAW